MKRLLLLAATLPLLQAGCLNVKTAPIEVKPIHITVDVNVRVEKALDDFFGDLDKAAIVFADDLLSLEVVDGRQTLGHALLNVSRAFRPGRTRE